MHLFFLLTALSFESDAFSNTLDPLPEVEWNSATKLLSEVTKHSIEHLSLRFVFPFVLFFLRFLFRVYACFACVHACTHHCVSGACRVSSGHQIP